jgi:exosortase/archaeosortase family protein
MPGLSVEVAEECSGIRSTVVLFITSLLAGQFFLNRAMHRAIIALMIIPLGIFRNALRIGTISLLTVHVDPGVIHGPIHKSGGPPFFVLSLIPLFLELFWFRRRERKGGVGSQKEEG